jgi:hypothetical protein
VPTEHTNIDYYYLCDFTLDFEGYPYQYQLLPMWFFLMVNAWRNRGERIIIPTRSRYRYIVKSPVNIMVFLPGIR